MTPQQFAFDNNMSVQDAKRFLGNRRTKGAFKARQAAPAPRPQPDATPAVVAMPPEAAPPPAE